jgi:hypothetical protein
MHLESDCFNTREKKELFTLTTQHSSQKIQAIEKFFLKMDEHPKYGVLALHS